MLVSRGDASSPPDIKYSSASDFLSGCTAAVYVANVFIQAFTRLQLTGIRPLVRTNRLLTVLAKGKIFIGI